MSERNSEAEERAREWLRRFGDAARQNGVTIPEAIRMLAELEIDIDPMVRTTFSEDERASRIQGRALPPPVFDFESPQNERALATDRINLQLALKNSDERKQMLSERVDSLRKANDVLDISLHGEITTATRYDPRSKKR